MKVNWKSGDDKVKVEFETNSVEEFLKKCVLLSRIESFQIKTDSELFEKLSELENTDVLKTEACGKCGCNETFNVTRENEGNKYYELRCPKCYAKLAFGSHKKGGGLFAKRKDAEGKYKENNGWVKYNKDSGKEE